MANKIDLICRSMEKMGAAITGHPVRIKPISLIEGVAYQTMEKGQYVIGIAFEYADVSGLSEKQAETIFYGLFTHEVMHILRTNLEKCQRMIKKFPKAELPDRHKIWNIVEDPAIEYMARNDMSETLYRCLKTSINHFYKESPNIEDSGDDSYLQYIAAMIQFGDVGALKGYFTFDSAEKAFKDTAKLFLDATEESDCTKRFKLSQEIFDIIRPLYEEHQRRTDAQSSLQKLMTSMGKSTANGGSGASNGMLGSKDASNSRRRKIVHLIDEDQAKEKNLKKADNTGKPGELPNESYAVDSGSTDNAGKQSVPDGAIVIDERRKKPQDNKSASESSWQENSTDSSNPEGGSVQEKGNGSSQSVSNGSSSPDNDNTAGSEKGSSQKREKEASGSNSEKGSSPQGKDPDKNASFQDKDSEKDSSSQSKSPDKNASSKDKDSEKDSSSQSKSPDKDKSSSDEKGGSSSNGQDEASKEAGKSSDSSDASSSPMEEKGSSSEGSGSTEGNPSSSENELKGSGKGDAEGNTSKSGESGSGNASFDSAVKELENEASSDIGDVFSKDLEKAISSMLEGFKESEAAAQKRKSKSDEAENIRVEVKSPYYKDVDYKTEQIDPMSGSSKILNDKITILHPYIINLRSELRKIFKDQKMVKTYKTTGKVSVKRMCGQKVTARLFEKKSKPSDKTDMSIVILVDESGSMRKDISNVQSTVLVLLESLKEFDIPVKVIGFTSCGSVDALYKHYGKWKNDEIMRSAVTRINAAGGTFLGHAIRYAGNLLKNRLERNKLFIVITDGQPYSRFYSNPTNGLNDCRYAAKEISRFADVVAIGIPREKNDEEVFRFIFGNNFVLMHDTKALIGELPKRIGKIIRGY